MLKPGPRLPQGLFLRPSISVSVAIYSPNSCSLPVYVPINKTNIKRGFRCKGSNAYCPSQMTQLCLTPYRFWGDPEGATFCGYTWQTVIKNPQNLRERIPRMEGGYLKVF